MKNKYSTVFLVFFFSFILNLFSEIIYKGNDSSFIDELLQKGARYKHNGVVIDPLQIYKNHGINTIRLRVWNVPETEYCNLERTLLSAKKIKENDLFFILNLHYSDTWADPGKQKIPKEWKNKNFNELKKSVYKYSQDVIYSLKNQNTLPDIIQIGNEIDNGMLFPYGKIKNIKQFVELLQSAINGVNSALTTTEQKQIKIMIHISSGGNKNKCEWFFKQLTDYKIEFDIIGLSYYPWWHGNLIQLEDNINNLAFKFKKDIIITETAYPWTLQWYDNKHNIVGEPNQLLNDYPAAVEGQKAFLKKIIKILNNVPDKRGIGIVYWAGDYISIASKNSSWENLTFFDFNGNLLDSINAFK